jgi:hypothetical protein
MLGGLARDRHFSLLGPLVSTHKMKYCEYDSRLSCYYYTRVEIAGSDKAQAYSATVSFTGVKSFTVQTPGAQSYKLYTAVIYGFSQ